MLHFEKSYWGNNFSLNLGTSLKNFDLYTLLLSLFEKSKEGRREKGHFIIERTVEKISAA